MLKRAAGYLAERGCDSPRLDAELLLADVLGVERLALYTDHERPLTEPETAGYREHIARRAKREPVAYILGRRGFRELHLTVGPGVLVPRPETEHLVEWVLEVAPQGGSVLDWGTGSGAIALAVRAERPDLTVTAIDRSAEALAIARANDPDGAVTWLESDGFAALADRRFDVVAANPPYLAADDPVATAGELAHEPPGALVSGPTGLEAFASVVGDAPRHLEPGGWMIFEVGLGQAQPVADLLLAQGFVDVAVRRDLAGVDRNVGGRRP